MGGGAVTWPRIPNYSERGLKKRPRALHGVMFQRACSRGTAHIPAVRPSTGATHARAALGCVSGGSSAALSRCSSLLSMQLRRLYTSQVHHTSHVTSLASNMLVCCDTWWRRRAMTPRYVHVSNKLLLFASISV